jgi:hypothetical protein
MADNVEQETEVKYPEGFSNYAPKRLTVVKRSYYNPEGADSSGQFARFPTVEEAHEHGH